MKVTHRVENNICIFDIEGNIVVEKVGKFKTYLNPFVNNQTCKGIVINFANVGVIDSSGIGVLVSIYKSLKKRQAKLVLYQLKPHNQEALELNQLESIIPMYPTKQEALDAFKD